MIEIKRKVGIWIVSCLLLAACGTANTVNGQGSIPKKAQVFFNKGLQKQGYGEYNDAITLFKQAIKKAPGFIDAYDALGNTYQKNNEPKKSISVYKKLLELKSDHYFALYELGKIYHEAGTLDSAEYFYRNFLNVNRTNDSYAKEAQMKMSNIAFAKIAIKNPADISPINMGKSINTSEQEYSPAFSIDENTIYITRRTGDLTDRRPNEDLYFATKNENGWDKIKNLGPPINTVENEGAFSVSADGHYIFFTSCSRSGGKGQCDIWLTIDKNGKWGEPLNLQAPINTKYWESQPSIASNGRVLYFTSDRPGGFGGTDIWKSEFSDSGWIAPVNLGRDINTSKDEQFPFIHSDNVTLYFSSEGHPGMGKSDLFITRLQPDGEWDTPKNLGYPINTSGYDWNMIVTRDGSSAYYSSDNMPDGEGGLDIYTFQLPENLRAKRVSYVRGYVRDAATLKPLSASVVLTPLDGNKSTISYADGPKASFVVPLKADIQYALTIDKKGYLFHSENFDMPNVPNDKPFEIYIDLDRLEEGKTVVLNNIFFDTDKFELKSESTTELEKLSRFMTENSTVHIEIGGHTDNVGSSSYNLKLSNDRAKSVYEYLTANGVDLERLSYRGYGDASPVTDNDTKEDRSTNRRTEFKIIKS